MVRRARWRADIRFDAFGFALGRGFGFGFGFAAARGVAGRLGRAGDARVVRVADVVAFDAFDAVDALVAFDAVDDLDGLADGAALVARVEPTVRELDCGFGRRTATVGSRGAGATNSGA